MKKIAFISLNIVFLTACQSSKTPQSKINDQELMQMTKARARMEQLAIDKYVERMNWPMEKSGTGLLYWEYYKGSEMPVEVGDFIEVQLIVSLTNGDTCYHYNAYGTEKFEVEHGHIESGLHEAVQKLHLGSKAKVILPSHLAHGLTGDLNKIPMNSTVVYDVEVVSLRKP